MAEPDPKFYEVELIVDPRGRGRLWVNGRDMSGVRRIVVEAEAQETTKVTLEFIARVTLRALTDAEHIDGWIPLLDETHIAELRDRLKAEADQRWAEFREKTNNGRTDIPNERQ